MISIPIKSLVEVIAACDPAAGKRSQTKVKRTRSRSAIVVIGQDLLARVYLLKAWAERCLTSALTEEIFKTQVDWKPRLFTIDSAANQSLYGDELQMRARERGIHLPLVPFYPPTNIDKDWNISNILQPLLLEGRLVFQPTQYEAFSEMEGHPTSRTKDIIDAIAMAVSKLSPIKHHKVTHNEEAEYIIRNLREIGAPAWYIDQRNRELTGGSLLPTRPW